MPYGDRTGPFGEGPIGGKCYGFGRRFRDAEDAESGYARRCGFGRGQGTGRGFGRGRAFYIARGKESATDSAEERINKLEKLIHDVLKKLEDLKK